jgi:heme/copper-type cytochrome/quinol oxidase subunit 2
MKKPYLKLTSLAASAGFAILAVALTASSALALDVTGNSDITGLSPSSSLSAKTIINNIVNIILYAAGILAIVYLIWGGVTYITAGGDAEKATKGRVAITNAIIGIAIIVAALAIFKLAVQLPGGTDNIT